MLVLGAKFGDSGCGGKEKLLYKVRALTWKQLPPMECGRHKYSDKSLVLPDQVDLAWVHQGVPNR